MARKRTKTPDETPKNAEPGVPLGWITPDLRPLARPVGEFTKDPRNARVHGDRNLDTTMASLRDFGQRKPIVVNRAGMVVEAGNGTLACALRLGWTHIAAVIVDDDPTTATGYAIADNRTAELATWDQDVLGDLLDELHEAGELESAGFTEKELFQLLGGGPDDGGKAGANGGAGGRVGGLVFRLVVELPDEAAQGALLEELEKRGLKCQMLMS